ncbi:fimbrial assembly protein [Paraburkholderia sp. Tr-20389]|uniref:fimbrial assembly protein n=1 Tax=Paraburkholderia sp. Tr-20389 TaxID=2703903 RepID=UPI0019814E3C|nr:fimbrial assembly protein [Paraburkholderia sp. Tr-20389]MBN3755078.1 fimbrial assembly protein [Paraburkholderia sp. Tr-20389]
MTAARSSPPGFNLLPHRQRDARLARRRRYIEWTGAALCGCVAVALLTTWQAFERSRLDSERSAVGRELAALASPLAEHGRLTEEARNERLQNERAAALSEPLVHLLDLLDALSQESSASVVVRQLRHRERDTELLAASSDHAASAAWLNRLAALKGVKDSDLGDVHRATNVKDATDPATAFEVTAHLRWDGVPVKSKVPAVSSPITRGKK